MSLALTQVSCEVYCNGLDGAPWNAELPIEWNGATCYETSNPRLSCKIVPKYAQIPALDYCVCTPTGLGWYSGVDPRHPFPPSPQGVVQIMLCNNPESGVSSIKRVNGFHQACIRVYVLLIG